MTQIYYMYICWVQIHDPSYREHNASFLSNKRELKLVEYFDEIIEDTLTIGKHPAKTEK